MIINKTWAMPNKNIFIIKPINELINYWLDDVGLIIDPFANTNELATITNDIDPQYDTDYHLDALDFLKSFEDESVDAVLYDPPFSPRQVSESYKKLGMSVNMQTTQVSFWGNLKKEISRIVAPNGIVISCGWNSNGIGKKNGFVQREILLVAHGGNHNDTIVVVEEKIIDHSTTDIDYEQEVLANAAKIADKVFSNPDNICCKGNLELVLQEELLNLKN